MHSAKSWAVRGGHAGRRCWHPGVGGSHHNPGERLHPVPSTCASIAVRCCASRGGILRLCRRRRRPRSASKSNFGCCGGGTPRTKSGWLTHYLTRMCFPGCGTVRQRLWWMCRVIYRRANITTLDTPRRGVVGSIMCLGLQAGGHMTCRCGSSRRSMQPRGSR